MTKEEELLERLAEWGDRMNSDVLARWPKDNRAESFIRKARLLDEVAHMLNDQILGMVGTGTVHIFNVVNDPQGSYSLVSPKDPEDMALIFSYESDSGVALCGREFTGLPHYGYIRVLRPERVRQHMCLLCRDCLRELIKNRDSQNGVECESDKHSPGDVSRGKGGVN